jgi:hypothetical protein
MNKKIELFIVLIAIIFVCISIVTFLLLSGIISSFIATIFYFTFIVNFIMFSIGIFFIIKDDKKKMVVMG